MQSDLTQEPRAIVAVKQLRDAFRTVKNSREAIPRIPYASAVQACDGENLELLAQAAIESKLTVEDVSADLKIAARADLLLKTMVDIEEAAEGELSAQDARQVGALRKEYETPMLTNPRVFPAGEDQTARRRVTAEEYRRFVQCAELLEQQAGVAAYRRYIAALNLPNVAQIFAAATEANVSRSDVERDLDLLEKAANIRSNRLTESQIKALKDEQQNLQRLNTNLAYELTQRSQTSPEKSRYNSILSAFTLHETVDAELQQLRDRNTHLSHLI